MKMKPLTEFCALNMGQSPSSETYNDENVGLPFFQGNADFGEVHPKVRIWCSSPVKVAAAGDILISVRAPIGAMNIANTPCCIGRGLAALSPNPGTCVQEYLYYALQSRIDSLIAQGTGSTFKAIGKKTLEDTHIPAYSLDEQQIISDTLSETDQLITKTKAQVSLLDQLVKSRFVEMFGDPVDNDKLWRTEKLDNICSTIVDCPHSTPSYTTDDTGYMCIRTSIVKKNHILWDQIEYIPEHEYHQRIQRKKPEKGDIVYTREGAILGIAAMIDRDCKVALGQRSMLLSPNTSKCSPQFLSTAMNFDSFLRKVLSGISGSASPHINVGDIKAFSIIVPPLELQTQFSAFVAEVDKSKLAVKQSLEKLETLKKSLMQEYFG